MAYKVEAIVETEDQKEKLEEVIRGYLTTPIVTEVKEEVKPTLEEKETKKTKSKRK